MNNDGKICCEICGARVHAIHLHLRDAHPDWTIEKYIAQHSVTEGETVDLHEFGKFELVHKPGRTARNPATGAPVEVPPKKVATFTVAKAFREQVNS